MDTNNPNQPVNTPVTPVQKPNPEYPVKNQKGNLPIILGVFVLLLMVGGGVYYLGTQNKQPVNKNISVNPTLQTNPTPTQTYKSQSYKNEQFGFEVSYPEGWYKGNEELTDNNRRLRVDILKDGEVKSDYERSDIAIIISDNTISTVENQIVNEYSGKLEGNKSYGNLSGKLYTSNRLKSSHFDDAPNSQSEFVTSIKGKSLWFRLFSTPENIENDRIIFYQVLSSFKSSN